MAFSITSGFTRGALKVVIYGPEGIGKTLLASRFPDPVFIDTEDSTKPYNVKRITSPSGDTRPASWTELKAMVQAVRDGVIPAKTLALDTLDWAEMLCIKDVCARYKKSGIEDFGYGKGYTYAEEEWGGFLNLLSEVQARGIHLCCAGHATMRRVELPEETGAYDHWEMKLEKRVAALTKEWADIILFCNYKMYVISGETKMDKNKVSGGARVMYSTHTPWWDAKNRYGLPEEMPLAYEQIAHLFNTPTEAATQAPAPTEPEPPAPEPVQAAAAAEPESCPPAGRPEPAAPPMRSAPEPASGYAGIPVELANLMALDGVTAEQVQAVVAEKGYYPAGTPISCYDPAFINGCLVACWNTVKSAIKN